MTVSVIGLVACVMLFATLWLHPEQPRIRQLRELVDITCLFLQFALTLIIAWRGGNHPPNVALALAMAFIFGSNLWDLWQADVWPDSKLFDLGAIVLSYLGGSLFIRSAQLFPRAIEPSDVLASPTIWGRIRALRAAVIFLLRPWAVWAVSAIVIALSFVSGDEDTGGIANIAVLLLGILFFYITFRSGNAQARAKVLWFMEAAVALLALIVILLGVRAVLGDTPAPTLRASLSLVLTSLNGIVLTTCFAAAVFYAGAIDPALVVRRTLVIGTTVTVLLFAFAAIEHYLVHLLVHGIGVTDSIATAILGALFGYAFHPLKHRLEHFLKRFGPAKAVHETRSSDLQL
jgi:hypothetical protein